MSDNILVTEGTAKAIAADDVSSVWFQRVKLDVGADGVSSAFTGTIGAVTNVAGGTIARLGGGTLTNLASGTVNTISGPHEDYFGSVGTIGATATGTLVGSVAGSAVYITDIAISCEGAATVTIGNGTPTVRMLGPLYFAANGGCISNLMIPLKSSVGSDVVYNTGGGTVSISATGYID